MSDEQARQRIDEEDYMKIAGIRMIEPTPFTEGDADVLQQFLTSAVGVKTVQHLCSQVEFLKWSSFDIDLSVPQNIARTVALRGQAEGIQMSVAGLISLANHEDETLEGE